MRPINLSLADVYRAGDVYRWQIVKVGKQQSLAEHSYQVAMIAARICQYLGKSPEFTARSIWYALIHDLPEVLTGDIASPVKKMIDTQRLQEFEARVHVAGRPCREEEDVEEVVKAADLLEAAKFLTENTNTGHGERVKWSVTTRAQRLLNRLGAIEVMEEVLNSPGFILGVDSAE